MFTKETSKMIFSKVKELIPTVMEKPTKVSSITIDLMERVLINGLNLVTSMRDNSNKTASMDKVHSLKMELLKLTSGT